MSKIKITEVDLTTVEPNADEGNDVVYIPGFSSLDSNSGTAAAVGVPTLCRTLYDFNRFFGSTPAVFTSDQAYPAGMFSSYAVPSGSPTPAMFKAGAPDPSYIYAKELITAGIPVIYERVNTGVTENDITVVKMYEFLSSNYTQSDTVDAVISLSGATVTVNKDTFITAYPEEGTYIFTAELDDETIVWKDSSDNTVNLTTIGLSISGTATVTDGTTITAEHFVVDPDLLDKDAFNVKYITSGGYPVFEYNGKAISSAMAGLAAKRGDAIALIDHTNNPGRALIGVTSVFSRINDSSNKIGTIDGIDASQYAAMYTPYCTYALTGNYGSATITECELPGSFAYLYCLATSLASNPSWLAIAGATRGKVANLMSVNTNKAITNSIADSYQTDVAVCINPITNIRPYGQCIWGNRTLKDNSIKRATSATSYLNIRNMVCDIKKQLYIACQSLLFEQNTDVLWVNFLSLVTPLLDRMVSGYGISNYKIIKENPSDKTTITATVRIYPLYAVEAFDITLYLQNGEVEVAE